MATEQEERARELAERRRLENLENQEWRASLDDVIRRQGPARVNALLHMLQAHAQERGVSVPFTANTPFMNTISHHDQPPYPGSREIERRIKSIVRWNAMAMVVRANRKQHGIGGHISTYASAATLYEVAFNHFFRGKDHPSGGDMVYFQGHASPGIYARAFLEGRFSETQLINFRRELEPEGGLSSYPHPRSMPEFWEYPTVSMGLTSIQAIYQARFNRYLEDRGLEAAPDRKVWAFLGDGEMDEPESLGAITLASREQLDNLIFVVNCNLQRLDGPVRGNGKVIQELEAAFRGAGWNVIKVIWGSDWDPLLEDDHDGLLLRRMEELVDGDLQRYVLSTGAEIREHFFGRYPELLERVKDYSDEQIRKMVRGGHDPAKVYAAYKAAVEHKGAPTVILAMTIKGYGLGEAGEGRNITHQQKALNESELREFRSRFGIPLSDDDVTSADFYRPADDSPEMQYLTKRRAELGGPVPERRVTAEFLEVPGALFDEYLEGTGEREAATTMVGVHMLSKLLRDDKLGPLIVPIVPDEARTFGMESLFRQVGIYSHPGQLYEPVDHGSLLYYNEKTDGAILEEGINEAGATSSFIAAGTAHATHGINTIPFFFFYSMFGFQRVGDLLWAAGDIRARGFLFGGTAGRTTLAGEGLQHQDGHSHVLALTHPHVEAYDPAFAYELAVIVRDGLRRMLEQQEDVIYYLTVMNEIYLQPPMPEGVEDGILRGLYRVSKAAGRAKAKVQLFGSGTILNEVLKAQAMLAADFDIAADVWSVTSYKALYRDALDTERWNRLHPGETPRRCYLEEALESAGGVYVAASDYMKAMPDLIARWLPGPLLSLGTDGFGLSETRPALRDHFEVDAKHVVQAVLHLLAREGKIETSVVTKAMKRLGVDPEHPNPADA